MKIRLDYVRDEWNVPTAREPYRWQNDGGPEDVGPKGWSKWRRHGSHGGAQGPVQFIPDERAERYEVEDDYLVREVPTKRIVCPRCNGEGKTCADGPLGGLDVTDSVREDPEFAEDYFRGVYDATCSLCRGLRVYDEPDVDALTDEERGWLDQFEREQYDAWAEREAERRVGA